MAEQIIKAGPPSEGIESEIRQRILQAIEGAEVEVQSGGPGHFEIRVTSSIFSGKSRVKQQQLVYGAISSLMAGADAPVHAVDKLDCITP